MGKKTLCNLPCGTKVLVLDAKYFEHVDPMGYSVTVIRRHSQAWTWKITFSRHINFFLSRLLAFEQKEEMAEQKLAPIGFNVPDPALQTRIHKPHQASEEKLDELKAVRRNLELFNTASVFICATCATNLLESVNQEILRETQRAEYGTYIDYILDSNASIPEKKR